MSERYLPRLCAAIECLCRVHTKDDPEIGFVASAFPYLSENGVTEVDYVEAWRALREAIGMQSGVRLMRRK